MRARLVVAISLVSSTVLGHPAPYAFPAGAGDLQWLAKGKIVALSIRDGTTL